MFCGECETVAVANFFDSVKLCISPPNEINALRNFSCAAKNQTYFA